MRNADDMGMPPANAVEAIRQIGVFDRDAVMGEARAFMSLGAIAAQYAAGQVVQGLVRTDGDVRVLRSYLDNARRQIADAQEQLLHAMVKLNDLERK